MNKTKKPTKEESKIPTAPKNFVNVNGEVYAKDKDGKLVKVMTSHAKTRNSKN